MATGPSSSATPYVIPTAPGVTTTSILTVGDAAPGSTYKMAGIPDGLGAFDNGDGTFTVLMNHEIGATLGAVHAHGSAGSFVSKWVIRKSDLSVVSGSDLIQNLMLWDSATSTYVKGTGALNALGRLCSADLAAPTAFYNSATGKGTTARLFLNGEETGVEGRAFAHIASGANAGTSYELPFMGKYSFENAVASPVTSDKTVVVGTDDGQNGQVYVYVGNKTTTGTDIDKAGLTNGKLFGIKVTGLVDELRGSTTTMDTRFTLADLGQVQNTTGAALDAASEAAGVTTFLRPEDGAWDPSNPRDFYFNTTDRLDQVADVVGTQVGNSRVWRLRFDDPTNPESGGTIEAVVDGLTDKDVNGNAVKVNMLDNMGFDKYGHLLLQEDVGGAAHLGKIWQYDLATDRLTEIAKFDPARFGDIVPGVGGAAPTILPATAPFNNDEESSGMIDVQDILGAGWFLADAQAHYPIPATTDPALVEGGQLFALYNPTTAISAGSSLVISEVAPWASSNSPYAADWFEVTNTGNTAVNISGWKIDDSSNAFATALALRGVNSIAPGESVIFIEGVADGSTDSAINSAFTTAWFGSTPPKDLKIGNYGGTGAGLSTGGDEVNLFNASGTRITGIGFGASTTGFSFDNKSGLGSPVTPVPLVSNLSVAGANGAIVATNDPTETGSPGSVGAMSGVRNDFNGDGKSDLLFRNADGSVAQWQMNGSAATSSSVGKLTSDWTIAGTGDFNADKKADLLLTNTDGRVTTWQMNGSAVTTAKNIGTLGAGWSTAGTGDFNGDGTSDVLVKHTDGSVATWQISGAVVTAAKTVGTLGAGWSISGTGDFNGDSKSDIVVKNTDGRIAMWQSNATGAMTGANVTTITADWSIAGIDDFNGDGKSDLLFRNTNGSVAEWQMNGSTVTATATVGSAPTDWKITGTGDFNGDRKADIQWRNDNGSTAIWQMNGSSVLAAGSTFIPASGTSWSVAA